MAKTKPTRKIILVSAHWAGLSQPMLMGTLSASPARGGEIFSFEYDAGWLKSGLSLGLDPNLGLFDGPQYPKTDHKNFGLFMDSAPDRWGRVLMRRREEQFARQDDRDAKTLQESDYLLGVFDGQRMGGLRFQTATDGPFLDDNEGLASPPWVRLRELEHASLQLERDDAEKDKDYMRWLKLLVAPGGSLGGARPKAGVVDEKGALWIAKFPSRNDDINMGGWEHLVYRLAVKAGIDTAKSRIQRFTGKHDTFLTKRFDRTEKGERIHFASAMTLLGRKDGDGAAEGVSYLDLAEFLIRNGADVNNDLEELWRRIVFNICVSNVDDHLRNHGFLLREKGWVLAPAYDVNPAETGDGLTLNISPDDNSQNLDLAVEVAPFFRVPQKRAIEILTEMRNTIRGWRTLAEEAGLADQEISRMKRAFRHAS
jgi:serine/threonine-protein kinase HipA